MPIPITWMVYDDNGAPRTGLSPTILRYSARSGPLHSLPTVYALGGGKYGFTPSMADVIAGVGVIVDNGVGSNPRYYSRAIYTPDKPFAAWHMENDDGTVVKNLSAEYVSVGHSGLNGSYFIIPFTFSSPSDLRIFVDGAPVEMLGYEYVISGQTLDFSPFVLYAGAVVRIVRSSVPVVSFYASAAGPRTPPPVIELDPTFADYGSLFSLTPSTADIVAGTSYVVASTSAAWPPYLDGVFAWNAIEGVVNFSVSQPDGSKLTVVFDEPVIATNAAYDPANYAISGPTSVKVASVEFLGSGTVRLSVSGQMQAGGTYALAIAQNTVYSASTARPNSTGSVSWAGVGPAIFVTSLSAQSPTTVMVSFSEPPNLTSMALAANYGFGEGSPLHIQSVSTVNDRTVLLHLVEQLVPGVTYSGFHLSVTDQGGNLVTTSITSFLGYSGGLPGGTYISSVVVESSTSLLVTLASSVLANSAFYDPSSWGITTRLGLAKEAYVRSIEALGTGDSAVSARLRLQDHLSSAGCYALRATGLTHVLGTPIPATPTFAFNA